MGSQTLTAILCVVAGLFLMVQSFSDFRVLSPKNEKMFRRVSRKSLRVYYGIFGVLFFLFGSFALILKVS